MQGGGHQGAGVLAVHDALERITEQVRKGAGPYFVEALTYRFRGHSVADPAEYRHKDEEAYWKTRDPIPSFRDKLTSEFGIEVSQIEKLEEEIETTVTESVQFADESPQPDAEDLYKDITA